MQRATASQISKVLQAFYRDMNALGLRMQKRESQKDFARFRDASAALLQIALTDILNWVYSEHPDLSPPELRRFYAPKKPASAAKSAARRQPARR